MLLLLNQRKPIPDNQLRQFRPRAQRRFRWDIRDIFGTPMGRKMSHPRSPVMPMGHPVSPARLDREGTIRENATPSGVASAYHIADNPPTPTAQDFHRQ
jgi:hypothetical protein